MAKAKLLAAWLGVLSVSLAVQPAHAYNISLKGRVHERLTRLAELCLEGFAGAMPTSCDPSGIASLKRLKQWRTPTAVSVRWPDDPTYQLEGVSAVKFAINAGKACESWFDDSEAAQDAPYGGLLCGSHYGPLQFMHAMRSSDGETQQQTRAKMLDWVDLAFRVATGRVSDTEGYCAYLRGRPAIGASLVPANFPYCETEPASPADAEPTSGWRVHTLFSMKCKNPVSSVVCTEYIRETGNAMARRSATGALLHLVQDSFSQSHARRGPTQSGSSFAPRIVCAPVSEFHFYTGQKKSGINHASADGFPKLDAISCRAGGAIHDPVTASATILWHVRANSAPETVVRYFDEHVLGGSS